MLERRLQHIDRQALDGRGRRRGRIGDRAARPGKRAAIDQLRRRIVEHYQAPRWHGPEPVA